MSEMTEKLHVAAIGHLCPADIGGETCEGCRHNKNGDPAVLLAGCTKEAAALLFEDCRIIPDNTPTAVVLEILDELVAAKKKHPKFPLGAVQQVAIMAEEAGEAIREANRILWDEGGTFAALRAELIQTAAMCVRCIENMENTPDR